MSWRRSFTHAPGNWEEDFAPDRLTPGPDPALPVRAGCRRLDHFAPGSTWEDLRAEGYRATVTLRYKAGTGRPWDPGDAEDREPKTWALVSALQVTNLLHNLSHPRCPFEVLGWHVFPLPIPHRRNKPTPQP